MNDYTFGNYIYDMRRRSKLTQSQLAEYLGVTDKAVSKWETGKSKPATQVLRKLAALWDVSVEEILQRRDGTGAPQITTIVITGGPCGGKTTAMSRIQNYFAKLGYAVLFIPETATELITGGVAPWTCGSNLEFQKCQMRMQLEKEKVFLQAAASMKAEKVLVVCDRGAMDNKAYMDAATFMAVVHSTQKSEVELRDTYDAVFHLVTAAKGAEEFYTTANNTARTETPEEAAALDDRLIAAWTGHPHLRVIDNSTDFEAKMKRLLAEISSFLGEPEPYEIERKFLIEFPNLAWLESLPNCEKVEIIQTYLRAEEGEEVRVRQRGAGGHYLYYQTIKRNITPMKRLEVERRLSKDEYLSLLMEADTTRRQIRKNRYCLTYQNQYFEIDIYPFWKEQAIAEIELTDENARVEFPKEIRVIKDVTEDGNYRNAALARMM